MSAATKKRLVTRELNKGEVILPGEQEIIAQIAAPRGNNLHEVEDQNGHTYLASMPTKFRKSAWIKRGDFVFVQPIEEGDKVKAEITHILYPENIAYIKEEGQWPARFSDADKSLEEGGAKGQHQMIDADMLPPSDSDSDSDGGQTRYNPNRQDAAAAGEVDEDSSSEDEEEKS